MILSLLHQIPLIREQNFSGEEKKNLKKYFKIRTFKKKEKILNKGEVEMYFNFVYKGLIRQYYIDENGNEVNTRFADAGDIICSEFSYFSGTPSGYISEAVENSTLLSITVEDMDYIQSQGMNFLRFGKLLMARVFFLKEERERKFLSNDAKKKVELFYRLRPKMALRLSQINIASYLNLKPETFSKLKKAYILESIDSEKFSQEY
ncbi:MAG: Crp/Fnr family transcriptional regulator [Bacteroidota bacterium]|jgi:CRP-like cAMP-binding protein|nr:Crp/Fnr family transcriptional regulator [Bacteroidota bacterium]